MENETFIEYFLWGQQGVHPCYAKTDFLFFQLKNLQEFGDKLVTENNFDSPQIAERLDAVCNRYETFFYCANNSSIGKRAVTFSSLYIQYTFDIEEYTLKS